MTQGPEKQEKPHKGSLLLEPSSQPQCKQQHYLLPYRGQRPRTRSPKKMHSSYFRQKHPPTQGTLEPNGQVCLHWGSVPTNLLSPLSLWSSVPARTASLANSKTLLHLISKQPHPFSRKTQRAKV